MEPNAPLPPVVLPNIDELTQSLKEIATASERLLSKLVEQQNKGLELPVVGDDSGLGKAFLEVTSRSVLDPFRLAEIQVSMWHDYMELWQGAVLRVLGSTPDPVIKPASNDRRFKDEAWDEYFVFDFVKQSYLLASRALHTWVSGVDGMDEHTARKVEFYTRQFIDALSPSNFLATNPEVLRETMRSGGQNLLTGLRHLIEDLDRGGGRLNIRMTDLDAFELGKNIGSTPGKVVFQNDMMQLLQYQPTTENVRKRPLLIVPPWINKFYILDLREKNSFIKWCVDQGHTVFVISWINPDANYATKDFDDYLKDGTVAATDVIAEITGEREVNAVGYCLGGTLLSCTMAHLAARKDTRIQSATLFTTMLDFAQPGELEVFIDEEQISLLERRMEKQGYLDGSEMATTFSMLRANDLIWSFVVNNYLLGKEPFPFDLLYWNSDSTRMPAAMHSSYLRNMYQKNLLCKPAALTMCNTPIDLGKVKTPVYFLSAIEDHIAPWKSTFAGTRLFSGPVKFVLGASGHIAGVINPPSAKKYGYWTNSKLVEDPDQWHKAAQQHAGSWWTDWDQWVSPHSGGEVPARKPGSDRYPPLEDAPGSYVKQRLTA